MRIAITLVLAAMLAGWSVEVTACGDKFIRIGRMVRPGKYVAIHAAALIVFAPPHSAPARVRGLAATLKKAGHSPVVITDPAELAVAMRSGKYALVLAGIADAQALSALPGRSPAAPDVVPVLVDPTPADLAAARAVSSCRLNLPGDYKNDALAEIDHRMELRLQARDAAIR